MTTYTTAIHALTFKTERDLILVNLLSSLLIAVIAFFPNSPVRIILGLPFILFFPGYMLICALFPRKENLDMVERLTLSMGLSIAVTSLIGLMLNYTPFGIRLYPVTFSLFLFMLLMSAVAVYRRRIIYSEDAFAPLSQMSISGCFERVRSGFIKSSDGNRVIKIIAIVAFIFIILALTIITKTPPASGYEISIYDAYPWYFWVFIITSIFMGQIILMRGTLSSDKTDNPWFFGFFAIITTNIILLFMPFIRGYATYGRGDVLSHIGYIKDILRTASFGTDNYYPIVHILTASLSYVTDINVEHAVNVIPPIFSIFYIISIYFLALQIFKRKSEVLFVLAFALILLFSNENLIFAPSVQSFFLLPFVLYLYFKSRDSRNPLEFGILLIISLFLIVFFHPMTTLFLILVFLILEFCLFIHKNINKNQGFELPMLQKRGSSKVILISFITFFTWYFSFSAIVNSFRQVLNWLRYEIGRSEAETYSELIARTQPDFFDLIKVILNTYGQITILGFLSLIFLIHIFNIWRRHTGEQKLKFYHIFFSIGSLIYIVLSIIFFFNDFIIGFGRVSKYTFFFSSVFVALNFYLVFNKSRFSFNKQRFKSISLCITLILLLYFSTFNLYFSPIIKSGNQQVTETEINGMTLFFDHRNEELFIQEMGLSQKRFHDAIFGISIPAKNIRYGVATPPVDHFDYINKTSLGEYYEDQRYLLISLLGRISYPELHPKYEKQWRFTAEDFCMLEKDNTVLRIYDNGNLNIYFISRGVNNEDTDNRF
jgi:hypothetical protein